MNTRWTLSSVSLILFAFFAAAAGPLAGPAPVAPTLTTLQPGGFRNIHQTLDVNIVFVGYEPGSGPRNINAAEFGSVLPHAYRPAHRYPTFYQGVPQEMGLSFAFDYNMVMTSTAYENAFFGLSHQHRRGSTHHGVSGRVQPRSAAGPDHPRELLD